MAYSWERRHDDRNKDPGLVDAASPSGPRGFYRYRSMGERSLEFTRDIVVESKLFFSIASDFNDPFDSIPFVRVTGTRPEVRKYFQDVAREFWEGASRQIRRAQVAELSRMTDEARTELMRQNVRSTFDKLGICCFADSVAQVLMWSHYADNHKGVCLRFDAWHPWFQEGAPRQVLYRDERPALNVLVSKELGFGDALATKAKFWEYEREWRFIQTGGRRACAFPPEALEAIYLGCKASTATERTVFEWIEQRGRPLEVFRARVARDTFALEFEKIA
jgi:hypothetical protein